jgi:hypothetical protein
VKITPRAKKYEMGGRLIHHRDPLRCKLHDLFLAEVEKGTYQLREFEKSLDVVADGERPCRAADTR